MHKEIDYSSSNFDLYPCIAVIGGIFVTFVSFSTCCIFKPLLNKLIYFIKLYNKHLLFVFTSYIALVAISANNQLTFPYWRLLLIDININPVITYWLLLSWKQRVIFACCMVKGYERMITFATIGSWRLWCVSLLYWKHIYLDENLPNFNVRICERNYKLR